jgi:small subunit ribosomal protein S8
MTKMINDRVGDMITILRNANIIKKQEVNIPNTKITFKIAEILKDEGFIGCIKEIETSLTISLNYKGKQNSPSITRLKRISTPGLRVYVKNNEIPKVLGGIGIAILSTSQGLMTDRQARAKKIGGEVLCYIW